MYKRILVPIDGSPTSTRGLDEAIQLGRLTGATLLLLNVLDELVFVTGFEMGATYADDVLPRLRQRADQTLASARTRVEAAGLTADTRVRECFGMRASDVIVAEAKTWDADLVVMGTHGRRGVSRLMLGSDAERVLRASSVPVLIVRGLESAVAAKPGAAAQTAATGTSRVAAGH